MISRNRFHRAYSVLIGLLLLSTKVKSSVLGEVQAEHLKDVVHKDEGEALQHEKHKGEKLNHQEIAHTDNTKSEYSDAKDAGSYVKKDADIKGHDESSSFEGQNHKQDKAEDSEVSGYKKGHKKGHHNQGFHNSYHKDESSNKSTFFDDLNDEVDQSRYNSRHNSHDDKGGRNYQGSRRDGSDHVRNNYNAGGYNRQGGVGNKHVGRNNYDRNKYLNDHLDYNKHHKGRNAYDRDQQYGRDGFVHGGGHGHLGGGFDNYGGGNGQYGGGFDNYGGGHGQHGGGFDNYGGGHDDWGGPGYYGDDGFRHEGGYGQGPAHGYGYGNRNDFGHGQDYIEETRDLPIATDKIGGAPIVAQRRQTITIYEDPRYENANTGQLHKGSSDHPQLDVRPSSQRYARYDDTYYAPRSDGGGVETSKINRLVYYRRQ